MKSYKGGFWLHGKPDLGEVYYFFPKLNSSLRIKTVWDGYLPNQNVSPEKPNKIVITSHDKRAVVAQGSELTVDIEIQDSDGNLLDVTDNFAMPVGKVGMGNYTTLMIPFINGKASRSYIWNDAGEFEITSAMINMHLDESSKLDFDGFNITVAG